MIKWMVRLSQKSAECSRLQKQVASLQDDLADALARYQASAAREREMFAKLFEVKQQLHHEKWLSASYRTLAKERRAVEEADDIEDMLREAEGSW